MRKIGTVFLPAFDQGVLEFFEGVVVPIERNGMQLSTYAVEIAGVSGPDDLGGKIPIYFSTPEATMVPRVVPSFLIKRASLTPDLRRMPYYGIVDRWPTDDAVEVEVTLPDGTKKTGYDKYVYQQHAEGMNIQYDMEMKARTQREFVLMLRHLMSYVRAPTFSIYVTDSLGDRRGYDCVDVSFQGTDEIASVNDRTIGMQVSFTVQAELDTTDDREYPSVLHIIWNYQPLSGYEEYRQAVLKSVPLAYYRMDEESGVDCVDSSGSGLNGIYDASPKFGVAGALGPDKNVAVRLDGSDDHVVIDRIADSFTSDNQAVSIEGFFSVSSVAADMVCVEIGDFGVPTQVGIRIAVSGGVLVGQLANGVSVETLVGPPVVLDTWYHVCLKHDPSGGTMLYVDGSLVASATNLTWSRDVNARIGKTTTGAKFLDGKVDEVAFYQRALAEVEIQAHYQAALKDRNT